MIEKENIICTDKDSEEGALGKWNTFLTQRCGSESILQNRSNNNFISESRACELVMFPQGLV